MQQEWMQHPGIWLSNVLSRPPWPAGSPERRDRRPAASGSGIPYGAVLTPCPECCIRCNSAPFREAGRTVAQIVEPDGRQSRPIGEHLEALGDVLAAEGPSIRVGEHAARAGPVRSQGEPLGFLLLPPGMQRVRDRCREGYGPLA